MIPARLIARLTLLSTLFLIAAAASWYRTTIASDSWDWRLSEAERDGAPATGVDWRLTISGGAIRFDRVHSVFAPGTSRLSRATDGFDYAAYPAGSYADLASSALKQWFTFTVRGLRVTLNDESNVNPKLTTVTIIVPHWMLVLLFGLMPALWLKGRVELERYRARAARGCCTACGYDLRSTPRRCPECGEVPAPHRKPFGLEALAG